MVNPIFLLQRLLLVCISLFIAESDLITGCVLMILVHGIFFVVAFTQQPYLNPLPDALSAAASFVCMVNPIFLLLAYYRVDMNSAAAATLVLGVNFGLPLAWMTIGCYRCCKREREVREIVARLDEVDVETLEKTTRAVKTNDRALERDTSQNIASSFMIMAFGAFAGFTLIFVSYIWVAAQGNVVQHTPANLGRTYRDDQRLPACEIGNKLANVEYLYTGGWDQFTSRCCCRDHDWNPALNFSVASSSSRAVLGELELWTCPDLSPDNATNLNPSGLLHKLRRRVHRHSDGRVDSGLHLRPFCSPHFAPGVATPTYDDELLAYVVRYTNGTLAPEHWLW